MQWLVLKIQNLLKIIGAVNVPLMFLKMLPSIVELVILFNVYFTWSV